MTQKDQIARSVAEHLFATEEAIDLALSRAANLVGYLPQARQQVRVSARVGQPAIEQIIASLSMLSEARRQIVDAHQSLAACGTEARIPPQNFGGFIDKAHARRAAELAIVADRMAG